MQSIKNTAVSIVLLFLSYGVYQVITQPQSVDSQTEIVDHVLIDEPLTKGLESNQQAVRLEQPLAMPAEWDDTIPAELLDPHPPINDSTNNFRSSSTHQSTDTSPIENIPQSPAGSDSRYESHSFTGIMNDLRTELEQPALNAGMDNQSAMLGFQSNPHFETDSQLLPSTVMGTVNDRPETAMDDRTKNFDLEDVATTQLSLAETWPVVDQLVASSNYRQALIDLTRFYHQDDIPSDDRQRLWDWLDALAAKVIYSSEDHLRSVPYIIQPGDTIAALAREWKVPAQLIYNVNSSRIPDPMALPSGVEIKIIQGPFDAEIDSQNKTMTLFLENMYAGRFAILTDRSLPPGELQVVAKSAQDQLDRPYFIGLSNGGSLFAAQQPPSDPKAIGLALDEAEDIFSILSASSTVRVLR